MPGSVGSFRHNSAGPVDILNHDHTRRGTEMQVPELVACGDGGDEQLLSAPAVIS
jgi:hypothetical protein